MTDLLYIDGAGASHDLSDGVNTVLMYGFKGHGLPPFEYVQDSIPNTEGVQVRRTKTKPRTVDVPLLIKDTSLSALSVRWRALQKKLSPTVGQGKLRWTSDDGTQRDLNVYYLRGAEGSRSSGIHGNTTSAWLKTIITFFANDPYWYETSTTVREFTTGETTQTFFPFFPLRLSNSAVFSNVDITNSGDVEAWPVWTITGPGDSIKITNNTTSDYIDLTTLELAAGQVATIDTSVGKKTVTLGDGTNLRESGYLSDSSSLFSLSKDSNNISIEMSSSSAASAVSLTYTPRYETGE